jgi:hypothetical protein
MYTKLTLFVIILLGIVATGYFAYSYSGFKRIYLSFTAIALAFVTFFIMLSFSQGERGRSWDITDSAMRHAIASSVIVLYLYLVGTVVFWAEKEKEGQLPQLSLTFLSNFTSIIGVVIGFYFASSAVVEATRIIKGSHDSRNSDEGEQ